MGIRAPMPASVHVLALAHQGHLGQARALGEPDLAADEAVDYVAAAGLDLRSLGIAKLMVGDVAAAAVHMLRALSISSDEVGIKEPGNAGQVPARMIEIISPSGFENFFRELSEVLAGGPPDPEQLMPLAARCDVQLGQPQWLPDVIARYNLTPPM